MILRAHKIWLVRKFCVRRTPESEHNPFERIDIKQRLSDLEGSRSGNRERLAVPFEVCDRLGHQLAQFSVDAHGVVTVAASIKKFRAATYVNTIFIAPFHPF